MRTKAIRDITPAMEGGSTPRAIYNKIGDGVKDYKKDEKRALSYELSPLSIAFVGIHHGKIPSLQNSCNNDEEKKDGSEHTGKRMIKRTLAAALTMKKLVSGRSSTPSRDPPPYPRPPPELNLNYRSLIIIDFLSFLCPFYSIVMR
jgi:hypothetical protein